MNKPLIAAAAVAGTLFVGYAGASYHKNTVVREQVDAVPVVSIVMGSLMDPAGTWKRLDVTVKAD